MIRYLDIGCGNDYASVTKNYLHKVEYWGVDKSVYNNGTDDFNYMDRFIDADLEKSEIKEIPYGYFDVLVLSHVIEHLRNYSTVILNVIPKLSDNGVLYIERSTPHSMNF